MSDKDKALAKEYLKQWGADNQITLYAGLDELIETFAAALDAVRREARAGAWRDAIAAAKGELWEDTSAGHGPHRAQQNSVINCVIDALRTAAKADEERGE